MIARLWLFVMCVLLVHIESANAQTQSAAWDLGGKTGITAWNNDHGNGKVGLSVDAFLKYRFPPFGLAVSVGYDELKSEAIPPVAADNTSTLIRYLRITGIPLTAVSSIYLSNGPVAPFLYLGYGAMVYKTSADGVPYPDSKFKLTSLVPMGVGCEFSVSQSGKVIADVGYRFHGGDLDLKAKGGLNNFLAVNVGFSFSLTSSDDEDDDNDGLTNAEERRYGTDPKNPDTDGDGLKDGDEVHLYRTNPLKYDTDGDGLSDGEEIQKYHTDPLKADTDGDGLSDSEEILQYHTNPLKPDTDGDGLMDGDEVHLYHTDPLKSDTDNDGLSDWDEVMVYKTDPRNPDTDGDGLNDGDEVRRYKTDPLKADTDGGGVNDGIEVKRGTDPLDPRDDMPVPQFQLERGKQFILSGVVFSDGTANLLSESTARLQQLAQALQQNPTVQIEIKGHLDNRGSTLSGEVLSLRRAKTVKEWLVEHGVSGDRISTVGMGAREPIASNKTADGRWKNRRIEISVK
jgi:outer membrane protein OmpA-like peptidoglycan-associated protein